MRIRFTKPTTLTFVTGVDEVSGETETETEDFAVDQELECQVDLNEKTLDYSVHAYFGIADKVSADCFQFLKI